MEGEMIIKQNLKKQLTLAILAIIMVLPSVFIIIADTNGARKFINRIVGTFGFIFFGVCLIFLIKRLIKPKNILVINDKGIEDNSSAISLGFIPWDSIEEVYLSQVVTERFICININNIDERLNELSFVKRTLIKINLLFGYAPVSITLNSTKYKHEDVIKIIKSYWKDNQLRNI